jgi:hypothetical protein
MHDAILTRIKDAINVLTANITQCLSIKREHAVNYTGSNAFNYLLLAAKVSEHKIVLETLPSWDELSEMNKTVCDKEFFLALTNHVSDRVSAVQRKLNKYKNLKKNKLMSEITRLENCNGEAAVETRLLHEQELNSILNLELRRLISTKKKFENLTHEKPTKRFFEIAHNVGKGENMSCIKQDDGSAFKNETELAEYLL